MRFLAFLLLFAVLLVGCVFDEEGDDEPKQAADDGDDDVETDDDLADDDDFEDADILDEVNPFIGTAGMPIWGFGFMQPGPMRPNGLVKLGPDTGMGWIYVFLFHAGGYWYGDNTIRGFSHTHLPGTGIVDLGNILVMPVLGMSDERALQTGYRSRFSHGNEEASPGYYRVFLDRYGIDAQLTATMNAGYHRYTYPADGPSPYVVIDSSHSVAVEASWGGEIHVDAVDGEVYGYTDQHGGFSYSYGGMPIYFAARFSEPVTDFGTVKSGKRFAGVADQSGKDIAAYVGFAQGTRVVDVTVGISLIGVDQARANLDAEIGDRDFFEVLAESRDIWRERLGAIEIEGGTAAQRRIFRTAMMHLDVLPTNLVETGGQYMGFDRSVHAADGFTYYSDLSLWDTFRTYHPLMQLIRPEINRDVALSAQAMYEQGGAYPMWAQGIGETEVMIGTHSDTVIADAYLKGNTDFDIETIYEGLREHATQPMPLAGRVGIEDWIDLGYIAADHQSQSVSRTQEYALNDYCLGRLADALGYAADRDLFLARSRNYRNLWDDETEYFRPRNSDGSFASPFKSGSALFNVNGYTEGNARHWLWFVLHDVPDLVALFGGPDAFVSRLEEFFVNGMRERTQLSVQPWYWHGNEPDMHAAYLFNFAGRPDLTQYWVRWIAENRYSTKPDGLDGNDDGGSLSAWYVFTALGFYPLPCTDQYAIGSPLFPRAVVHTPDGDLEITAENASEENIYIQSVTLNGEPLDEPWFTHDRIANGGTLEFVMGDTSSFWGSER